MVAHLDLVFHPPPGSPSRQPCLLLVTANVSSAKRIGVISDPELVAVSHHYSHVRLPLIALCSTLR